MINLLMKKVLPILHGVLLFGSLLSPLWADWKIIVVGYILYILQKLILKGCILSFAQFGSISGKPKYHFTPYYLKKFFHLKTDEYTIIKYFDYVIAPLVPIIAILIQAYLGYMPFWKV